jgi:hypothetical protein
MYRRPKFLEILLDIRQEMAREADYDTDLFAEMVRTGAGPKRDGEAESAPKRTEAGRGAAQPKRRK